MSYRIRIIVSPGPKHLKHFFIIIIVIIILQIDIEFVIADDSKQATVLRPEINVCACHNQGTCVPVDENDADNSGARFKILSCECQNGYTGTFCEADLDACEENFQPCYPGIQCIDLQPPADASGFDCGPCPDGLTGDGIQCTGNGCFCFSTSSS